MIRWICQVLITVGETPNVTMEPYSETLIKNFCVFFWKVDPEEKSRITRRERNPIAEWNEKLVCDQTPP